MVAIDVIQFYRCNITVTIEWTVLGSSDKYSMGLNLGLMHKLSCFGEGGVSEGFKYYSIDGYSFLLGSMNDFNMTGLVDYHWGFNSNIVEGSNGYRFFWLF